jgi:hypothetical protein
VRDRHDLDRAPIALIALIVISQIYANTIGCARDDGSSCDEKLDARSAFR